MVSEFGFGGNVEVHQQLEEDGENIAYTTNYNLKYLVGFDRRSSPIMKFHIFVNIDISFIPLLGALGVHFQ